METGHSQDVSFTLKSSDWSRIIDALYSAADDIGDDLYETRKGDFYSDCEREEYEETQNEYMRLADLLATAIKEKTDA